MGNVKLRSQGGGEPNKLVVLPLSSVLVLSTDNSRRRAGVGRSLTFPPPEKTSPHFVPYSGDETKAPCKQGVSLSLLRCPRTKGEFAPPLVHPTDLPCCQEQHFLLWILPSFDPEGNARETFPPIHSSERTAQCAIYRSRARWWAKARIWCGRTSLPPFLGMPPSVGGKGETTTGNVRV